MRFIRTYMYVWVHIPDLIFSSSLLGYMILHPADVVIYVAYQNTRECEKWYPYGELHCMDYWFLVYFVRFMLYATWYEKKISVEMTFRGSTAFYFHQPVGTCRYCRHVLTWTSSYPTLPELLGGMAKSESYNPRIWTHNYHACILYIAHAVSQRPQIGREVTPYYDPSSHLFQCSRKELYINQNKRVHCRARYPAWWTIIVDQWSNPWTI